MFLFIYFNVLIFLIVNFTNLLFISFLNKFYFFLKFTKNSAIHIVFDTFVFRANNTMNKSTI